jgi:hypothetical protein
MSGPDKFRADNMKTPRGGIRTAFEMKQEKNYQVMP